MEFNEFINNVLLPLGGTSAVLVALAAFLGNVNTKRIINGDLAEHKRDLESLKSSNTLKLELLKQDYLQRIERLKIESDHNLEKLKNKLQTEFLKYETYTSISKEKFQELFEKRIEVYQDFLNLKKKIDDSINNNAVYFEFQDDDPTFFIASIAKINAATRKNPMLISHELANLSNELYAKSSQVLSNAKVSAFRAEASSYDGEKSNPHKVMEAEENELRNMGKECGDIYSKWFEQLEVDVSRIRKILDHTNDFLINNTNDTML